MVDEEHISSLMDGELEEQQEAVTYQALKKSPHFREVWRAYHVIGDVIRSEGRAGLSKSRFHEVLDAEPTIVAPLLSRIKKPAEHSWMKIAASFAAVAVVGWLGISNNSPIDVRIAKRDVASQEQQLALEEVYDEAIAEYLAAHKQFNPRGLNSSALVDQTDE
ncbi:MAG: sigma-E factor negative regulatory protein [Proteobacteria bacterium]|nr:sigma-E factor negative regulatory protein [Pseudomonadota bacterium]MDA1332255.1 sigma-E factor negative regulatory protein [Pseudomonadota bacterium]